ncbi:MAG: ABC transporter permease [Epulopiscium sp.]|nr:ABC transporter permease [Candidatus Epulonipiscium sp.]
MNDAIKLMMDLLPIAMVETLYMVFVSTLVALIVGTPIGVILVISEKGGIQEHISLNQICSTIVNIGRSFPFSILMVAIIPFTRFIVGTSLGTTAAIVPLSIAAIPFVARVIENALKEVDKGIIEAAQAMGATTLQIIIKVLIPEAMPGIVLGITLTVINLIGYSAMAGLVGGGGLGKIADQYGYKRYNTPIMISTIILLVVLVQMIQWLGNTIAKAINKK